MPECHKPFLGHCDLDLWPRFQELLCPEHISYIIWCRNPKFGVVIPLGMAEWCITFWVTLTLTLTSGLISSFFVLYYSYLSSNVSYTRPIPLGAFVTCLWHFLFKICIIFNQYIPVFHYFVYNKFIYSWYREIYRFCYSFYHGWKFSGLFLNSGFWGWLSTESQPQNADLRRL